MIDPPLAAIRRGRMMSNDYGKKKKKKKRPFGVFAERKLQPHEHPHTLYIQNYSTASATCLAIRRWLFNVSRPMSEQALTWIFWQTIDEVNRGHISAGERLYQLKALQDASRKHEVRP